jgi:choline dehydrogenase
MREETQRSRRVRGLDNAGCGQFLAIILILTGLIALFVFAYRSEAHNPNHVHGDFVIVGAGPAGISVAEILSRDPTKHVYLIEAGPNNTGSEPILDDVTAASPFVSNSFIYKYFWQFAQTPAEVIVNRPDLRYTGGRELGGSTRVNGMQYVRPTDYVLDQWVNLTDDEIWNTTNAINAYKEIEDFIGNAVDVSQRGTTGPLVITEAMLAPPQTTPTSLSEKYVTAIEQMTGLPRLDDYNRIEPASRVGPFLRWQVTAKYGDTVTRESADIALLTPEVLARPNLHIITNGFVTNVLIDKYNVAYGVRYIKEGKEHHAYARERVILSAGIQSPIILMHSGIGNATYLESIGITPVYDNPNVGIDARNHQGMILIFAKNSSDVPSANPADIYEGGAWLPDPNPYPNITEGSSPRRIQTIVLNLGPVMGYGLIHVQPIKTGYVKILDNNPLRPPESSDRILVPPEGTIDWETYVNAIKRYACDLRDEYQGFGVGPAVDASYEMINPPYSICSDDEALFEYVRENLTLQAYHWTSTAKMGKEGDGISVTNSRGSVWGVEKLTVCDNSIVPFLPDGNTQADAYLVGHIIGKEIAAGRV